jgi:hypothetical protein
MPPISFRSEAMSSWFWKLNLDMSIPGAFVTR